MVMQALKPIIEALAAGLPVLLPQFAASLLLLVVGAAVYARITPFRERRLVAEGNVAGGITMGGAILALAIPLSATLATSHAIPDIIVWGVVALVLQLLAFVAATLLIRDLRRNIEAGNVASAIALVGVQLAVAVLNAAAMAG
jgi:putative membrane protein